MRLEVEHGALDPQLVLDLQDAVPGGVHFNVSLASLSRWNIGGAARVVIEPFSAEQVARVMELMGARAEPFCITGDGSNLLFDDAGFHGVVLKIGRHMGAMRIEGDEVWAEAGIAVPELAWQVGSAGLTGIEHTVGIPGTLGGLILMNGGSQRKGIGFTLERVLCADANGEIFELDREECRFAYRSSILQTLGVAVVEATLRLTPGKADRIVQEMESILASRAIRFPTDVPNCGSTFLSDPAMYANVGAPGEVIEAAGLKGWQRGGAQISDHHANFFVNLGGASSDDMLWLIALARNTVRASMGFSMDCEVRHVAPDGRIRPAHEAAIERWGEALTRDSVKG